MPTTSTCTSVSKTRNSAQEQTIMGGKGLAAKGRGSASGKRRTPPASETSSPTKHHKQRGEPESQSTGQENSDGENLNLIIAKLIKMREAQKQDRVTLEFLRSKTESLEAQFLKNVSDILCVLQISIVPSSRTTGGGSLLAR